MERQLDGPIGLVIHPKRDLDRTLAAIKAWAEGRDVPVGQVMVDRVVRRVADPIEAADCAMIAAVGGDGTALAALHAGAESQRPVLGVACGSIGALTSIHADEIERALDQVADGDWIPRELPALDVRGDDEWIAINDIAVVRDGDGQLVSSISVDGQIYARAAGDGVIVATPIGSSAYTLAAGGPLLTPTCDNFAVTPVAPHAGSIPALVLSGDNEVELEFQPGYGGMRLEVDGQRTDAEPRKLHVTRRAGYARLVSLEGGEAMIAGLRKRNLVLDSPRAKLREERRD